MPVYFCKDYAIKNGSGRLLRVIWIKKAGFNPCASSGSKSHKRSSFLERLNFLETIYLSLVLEIEQKEEVYETEYSPTL